MGNTLLKDTKHTTQGHFHQFSLSPVIKLYIFASREDVTKPPLAWKKGEFTGLQPNSGMRGKLPLCQDPHPSPLPLRLLVLGSRFPSLTGKTYLEGGLKGPQTVSDRRCLAADVAGWYVTALRTGEEMGKSRGGGHK